MMKDKCLIIKSVLSQDLALRNNADYLFDMIEQEPAQLITLDFSEIRSISRSFAHQYLIRKNKLSSKKNVSEVNVPEGVQRMFDMVSKTILRDSSSGSRSI